MTMATTEFQFIPVKDGITQSWYKHFQKALITAAEAKIRHCFTFRN